MKRKITMNDFVSTQAENTRKSTQYFTRMTFCKTNHIFSILFGKKNVDIRREFW